MVDIKNFNIQNLSKNILTGCATELHTSTYSRIYCYPIGYKSDDNVTKKLMIRFNDPMYCPFGITQKRGKTFGGNPMTSKFIQLNLEENVEKFIELDEFILNYSYENRTELFGEKFKKYSLEEFKKLYMGLVKTPKAPDFPNFIQPNIKETVSCNPDILAYSRYSTKIFPIKKWDSCKSYIHNRSKIKGDIELYFWYMEQKPLFGVTCLLTHLGA